MVKEEGRIIILVFCSPYLLCFSCMIVLFIILFYMESSETIHWVVCPCWSVSCVLLLDSLCKSCLFDSLFSSMLFPLFLSHLQGAYSGDNCCFWLHTPSLADLITGSSVTTTKLCGTKTIYNGLLLSKPPSPKRNFITLRICPQKSP